MTARERILSRVRASLGAKPDDAARQDMAGRRIAEHPVTLLPERATRSGEALYAQFCALLEGQQATIVEVAEASAAPAAVRDYLVGAGVPAAIRIGEDARLASMPWTDTAGLTVLKGAAEAGDRAGLSYAIAGISETGTLVIAAGRDNPVTLAFMPETHVIVVARDSIAASYEQALSSVRERFGASGMPRTLNYISGPSRTADIGGKIVIGAHGPRRLGIIVVG